MSRNAGNAKTAYETATDQGEKQREKMAGKIEVTRPLAFHVTGCLGFIRRNNRVFGSFVLTKGTIEQNATEPAYVACA